MIEYLLSISLLIISVLVIRVVFRKTVSPRVIYALWLVVVIRMVIPVTLFEIGITAPEFLHTEPKEQTEQVQIPPTVMEGEEKLPENRPVQTPPTVSTVPTAPISPIIPDEKEPSAPIQTPITPNVPSEPVTTPDEPSVPTKPTVSFTPVQIINTVWFLGVLIAEALIIYTVVSYVERLRKSRKYYKSIGRIKVYISESADVPCVAGLIPSIYITPAAQDSESEDVIILHEYFHLRHGDHIWAMIRTIALAVFWWNPLVWIASTVSKHDSELACDDAVSSMLDDDERIKYANILIDTIPQKRKYAVGFGSAPMKERIVMLSKKQKNSLICIVLTIILALSAVGCSFTSFNEKETTSTEPETIPSSTDTEAPETDTETEPDTETENTDGGEIESYVVASGDGYVFAQPGGKLTISSDAGFEFVKNFHDKAWKKETKWYIGELTIEGSVTAIPDKMFSSMGAMSKVTIGGSVKSIGNEAFFECWGMRKILIPNTVTSIGNSAFSKCYELRSIQLSDNVTEIGAEAFYDCRSLEAVRLPNNITAITDGMFYGCGSLSRINIPRKVVSVGSRAFLGCPFTEIILPDGLQSIGTSAFWECDNLKSIQIPDSVTSIGGDAFYSCNSLENVKLSKNITEIQVATFSECEKLSSVDIPDGVTVIGNKAFFRCFSLTAVTMGDRVETIGERAFYECKNLTNIKISKNLKRILHDGFYYCEKLEYIDLPMGLEALHSAFTGCASLKRVDVPDSVVEVTSNVFAGCASLTYIEIPGKMFDPAPGGTLEGCTNLKSVVIKEGATRIGMTCMADCINLETVEIPSSVKYIAAYAFHKCTSLKEIRFKGTEEEWNAVIKEDKWDLDSGDYIIIFEN